jgi:tetratricopeptide (TPR) repeat protein
MFQRVDATLMGYRERWRALDAAVCRDGEDERAVALQRLCLAEAQVQLRTVAELAATAPDAWIPNAVGAAEGLPRLDECEQIDQLADRFPLPPEETTKAKVIDLRVRLARASALMDAELYDDARALVNELEPEVAAAGYPPLDAELALIDAGIKASLGELGPSEDTYWRAVALAHRADHTAMEAEAWAHLVFHVGRTRARPEEVMRWLPVAEAAVEVANAPSLEPMFAGNVGAVYFTLEDYEQARAYFEKALEYAVELRGPDSLNLVSYLNNIGTAYAIQGKADEARPYFERALRIRRTYYGDDHPDVASVLHNLGLLALAEGDDAQAEKLLRETLAVRQASLPEVHPDVALTLGMIGNVWFEREDFAKAAEFYRQSLEIRRQLHRPTHPEVTTMQSSLGLALGKAGESEEARTLVQRAIEGRIAEHGRKNVNVAEAYENLADVEQRAGDFEAALAAQRTAIEIRRETGADVDTLAYARNVEASLLGQAGRPEDALAVVADTLGLPELSATARAWTLLERARAQLAAGDAEAARGSLREAFDALEDDADELPSLAPPLVTAWKEARGDRDFPLGVQQRVRELAPESPYLEKLADQVGPGGG